MTDPDRPLNQAQHRALNEAFLEALRWPITRWG